LALADGHLGCQAGKDVYVEKPCSHTRLKTATGARGKKVQPDLPARSQSRSNPGMVEATKHLTDGTIAMSTLRGRFVTNGGQRSDELKKKQFRRA